MRKWSPCKRPEFIRKLRALGFSGPYSGGKHQFMRYDNYRLALPHDAEYSVPQLQMLLREISIIIGRDIEPNEWQKNLGTRYQFLAKLGHVPRFPFIPIGNGLNRRTLVYDKDVGRAVALTVSHPTAAGRIFNVTDGEFHPLNEIIESICSALGRKPPRLSLPVGPTRTLVGLIEKGSRGIMGTRSRILANSGHVPTIPLVTREMIDKYTEDIAVDGSLIQKELGFVPQYDLKTGWKETIREMQEKDSFEF